MPQYKISGVWKNSTSNAITHYALHAVTQTGITRAVKTSKVDAVNLLERKENSAVTWVWNYNQCKWNDGEEVQVIQGANGKYLRSNPDNRLTDNLGHLIDFDWIDS